MSATRITPDVPYAIDVDYDRHEGIWTFFPMHGELANSERCWIQTNRAVQLEDWQ